MAPLPAPFVPADADLRDFPFMPLDVARLRDSDLAANETPEACWAAVLLWAASWHQLPAASIPDDDRWIAKHAGYAQRGKIAPEWAAVRGGALHGWVKCSDGRLYHPVVAEKAVTAWRDKLAHRWRKECDRIRKDNKVREAKGLPPLEMPPHPAEFCNRDQASVGHGEGDSAPEAPGPTEIDADRADDISAPSASTAANPFPPESDGVPAETGDPSRRILTENALKGKGEGLSSSCPKRAAPVRTRRAYPEDFERFWSGYPTDPIMSKAKAGEAWGKLDAEDRQAALAAVPAFADRCRRDPSYRPVHAVRFLTERRFDGFAPKQSALDLKFGLAQPSLAQPGVDFGSGQPVPDAVVLGVLRRDEWIDAWGPKLGRPGCRLPQRIVDAVTEAV